VDIVLTQSITPLELIAPFNSDATGLLTITNRARRYLSDRVAASPPKTPELRWRIRTSWMACLADAKNFSVDTAKFPPGER